MCEKEERAVFVDKRLKELAAELKQAGSEL